MPTLPDDDQQEVKVKVKLQKSISTDSSSTNSLPRSLGHRTLPSLPEKGQRVNNNQSDTNNKEVDSTSTVNSTSTPVITDLYLSQTNKKTPLNLDLW